MIQKSIATAQQTQKWNYDRGVTDNRLKEGDLRMLKAEPCFCLDRQYNGPFHIQSLTTTNAVIKSTHDSDGEPINISRQRLSITSSLLETAKSWIGHSGKLRRCWKIQRPRYSQRISGRTGTASQTDTTHLCVTTRASGKGESNNHQMWKTSQKAS